MTNTGIPYEKLTQQIFDAIIKLDGVENVEVKHDVDLPGKSHDDNGRVVLHQIDVYWEFELAGIRYRTAIQAKDWGTSVPQGEVLKFDAVLKDLKGQPRGVMVARTGFQDGARVFANANGIELYELRRPTELDLANRFTKLGIELNLFTPSMEIIGIDPDVGWLRAAAPNITRDISFGADAKNTVLYAEDGTAGRSLFDVLDDYMPKEHRTMDSTVVIHTFSAPTFITTSAPELPRLKILAVTARIAVTFSQHKSEHDFSHMLTYILRNVSGDKTYFVDPNGLVKRTDQ